MINLLINRIFRAIKIDIDLYEEVEKDKSATIQAGIVVVLSSLAAGVGALQMGASNFLLAPVLSLLSWYVWAYVIYFVGVKLFNVSIKLLNPFTAVFLKYVPCGTVNVKSFNPSGLVITPGSHAFILNVSFVSLIIKLSIVIIGCNAVVKSVLHST